jgi:hypothetical protein
MLKHSKRGGAVANGVSKQRSSWGGLSCCDEPVKPGNTQRNYAPILVSCSGSDEGESLSDQQSASEGLLQQNSSITSTLDGMDSSVCSTSEPTLPRMITEAEVQAGCFKPGVRYCLETWPRNFILLVSLLAWYATCCGIAAASACLTCDS